MPNRILKESICTSEEIDKLSAFQETVFYRLIVNCDDFGRADARPKLLASKLFPLKDIRAAQIEDALRALTSAELVITYTVGGKPFLQMKTWDRHQQVRNKVSKFPSPEDADCKQLQSIDSNCNQMIANVPVIQSNPIQSESNPNPNPMHAGAGGEAFDRFWSAYPKKVGKQDAARAFRKVYSKVSVEDMIAAVEWQKRSDQWTRDGGRYIPNPSTWLNQGRWEDERRAGGDPQVQHHGEAMSPAMRAAVAKMMEGEDDGPA